MMGHTFLNGDLTSLKETVKSNFTKGGFHCLQLLSRDVTTCKEDMNKEYLTKILSNGTISIESLDSTSELDNSFSICD